MNHFLVFGTHPRLSLAEFAVTTACIQPPTLIGNTALVHFDEWNGKALMETLAGTVKLGDVLLSVPAKNLSVETYRQLAEERIRAGEVIFGFTVYDQNKKRRMRLERDIPIRLKREITSTGARCRWVTGKSGDTITPAAIAKLKLTSDGFDFVTIIDNGTAYIGVTTHVQDADAWSLRDYGRPERDDRAGMLPPKLARIMVNLAHIQEHAVVLDPFCGNGTILMEAGIGTEAAHIIGTDIDPHQTASTTTNLDWLMRQRILPNDPHRFEVRTCDVRSINNAVSHSINAVVTEGSLGPPLRGGETQYRLDTTAKELETLWIETLQSLKPLLAPNATLVVVWPQMKTDQGMSRVNLDHQVDSLGFEIIHPLRAWEQEQHPLVYHRPGQRISRRIVLLRMK